MFDVACMGIRRTVWAIVKPGSSADDSRDSATVLLGLPWLFDVYAQIDVRGQTLRIGDETRGEERQTIRGPELAFAYNQRLLLAPDAPDILRQYVGLRARPDKTVALEDGTAPSTSSSDSVTDQSTVASSSSAYETDTSGN